MNDASPRGSRLRALAPLGALALGPLLLFAPIFWDRVVELRDFSRWTWPSRALWRAAVLEGRVPQWNPFAGLGAPLTAAPVHGAFYPGHLLLLAGPPTFALSLLWLLHTIFAGVGAFALGRRLGCRPAVALAAASVWQLGDTRCRCGGPARRSSPAPGFRGPPWQSSPPRARRARAGRSPAARSPSG